MQLIRFPAARALTHLALAFGLVACGGGGSDGANSATVTPTDSISVTPTVRTTALADTAQVKFYNASAETAAPASTAAFYGQDAQVSGTAPSFTLGSDGKTVVDNISKLTWMRGPNTTLAPPVYADKKSWSALPAWVSSVNGMNYGGYSDWRLPTIKELYSLMNFAGTDASSYTGTNAAVLTPFIDTSYFNFAYGELPYERLIDSQYASSDLFVVNPGPNGKPMLFGLNLADGRIKGYDTITGAGTEKTFFVQLVRGAAGYGVNQLVSNTGGTVTDNATGLMWSKADNGSSLTWQDALAWVQTQNAQNHLGHNDWRMPNAKELQSLIHYANAPDFNGKPAIDTTFFDSTAIVNENGEADYAYYWTSTTHAKYGGSAATALGSEAVYIPFGRALGYSSRLGKWIDVHGAGCQRSDPKMGPPFAHATPYTVTKDGTSHTGYAFGPQSDAIRGLNMVRLVRNAS